MAKRGKRLGDERKQVPIERFIPDDVHLQFSDNVVVQHTENDFTLTFLQLQQPLAITAEEIADLKKVRSEAVARIVMTPAAMKTLIEILNRNYGKYVEKYTLEDAETSQNGGVVGSDMSSGVQEIEYDATLSKEEDNEE